MEKVKYFIKGSVEATGEAAEVILGETTITLNNPTFPTPYGEGDARVTVVITEKNADLLVRDGILFTNEGKIDAEKALQEEIDRVILNESLQSICNITKKSPEEVDKVLGQVFDINPAAYLSILLKRIAVRLDKGYKGHISDSKELWVFNLSTGKLQKIPESVISKMRSYNHNAFFRNEEDAKTACRIMRNVIKRMYDKQEG